MAIGEYLKGLRQAKGVSQKELSGLTQGQVSNAEISRLEAGIRKKPSPAVLKVLAPHLGVPVEALLTEAGYMDSAPAESYGEARATGGAPDQQQQAQLQVLEEERASLKAENRKLREETISIALRMQELEAANKELEKRVKTASSQSAAAGQGGGELEEELRVLRVRYERLKDENQRIKDETIVFLEEGDALRSETDNYRKRMNVAEDAVRKAAKRQESMEEELGALKKELAELRAGGGAASREGSPAPEGDMGRIMEEARLLEEENNALTDKVEGLTQKANELAEKNGKLEALAEELRAEIGVKEVKLNEASASKGDIAEREKKIEELQLLLEEESGRRDQLVDEKVKLEKELLAANETIKLNTPVMNTIKAVEVAGRDLGLIFSETVGLASDDDLDMLGRLMIAMNKDTVKSSDKRMLFDFLKRFIK